MDTALFLGLISLFFIFSYERWRNRQIRLRSAPPGPRGWPILGNVLDLPGPSECSWVKYASMAKQYGDIMYFEALGLPLLILSSPKRCNEILDKRVASGRHYSTMCSELTGLTWNLGFLPYGEDWRRRRLIIQNYFHIKTVDNQQPTQVAATRRLLKDILNKPSHFFAHARKHTGAIILKASYGYDVEGDNDPLVRIAEDGIAAFNDITGQVLYAVDLIPILKYTPAWFPGAGFRRRALNGKKALDTMINKPFNDVKQQIASKTANPSLAADHLSQLQQHNDLPEDQEEVIRDAAGVSYAAGSDTTVSSILTFIMAMTLYPEVQKKAQAELDLVVGENRLPTFEQMEDLPYIKCILWEVLRWQPVTPMGIPHSMMAEEVYDGYVIPAGTIIQPNIWAIFHDEEMYPSPHSFNPERFMKEEGKDVPLDPTLISFGFGRRICAGKHLALHTIWIAIASILSAFTIDKARDENGKEIVPEIAYTPGFLSYPKPFQCRFSPRSDEMEGIIQSQSDSVASAYQQ